MGATCRAEAAGNLGKYTLYEKMGEGYLGSVYRALDPDLGQAVAIRIVCDSIRWDAEVEARLHQECQAAAGLSHPNIAGLFTVGKEGPSHYIVTELLDGQNLGTLIAQQSAMPWEAKVSIMIKAAEGLSHAHRNGVLHRDLRPAKIHLGQDGSVKVRDFGIAHVLMKHLIHPGVRWGAPIYLSPEQVQLRDCDERSDMFSAGIIFYELLTFSHPFHDRNGNKALDNILFSSQLPTFEQFPSVPPGIWTILKTCLAKDPKERYGSMDELSSACRGFLKELADESQLMLSELHAALPRLRKAALQPDASESMVNLLHEVQKLSLSDEYAEYAFLDRLMTSLIEHYPTIQAVSGLKLVPEIQRPACIPREQPLPVEAPAEEMPHSPAPAAEPIEGAPIEQHAEAIPDHKVDSSHPADASNDAAATQNSPSGSLAPPSAAGEQAKACNETGSSWNEHQSPTARSVETQEPENVPASQAKSSAAPVLAGQESIAKAEPLADTHPASVYRYRKISRPAYRTAAVLMSILLMAVAVYIARGTASSLRTAWSTYMPAWPVAASAPAGRGVSEQGVPGTGESQPAGDPVTIMILQKEARTLVSQRRYDESKVLLRRILEIDPANEDAIATLNYVEAATPEPRAGTDAEESLRRSRARVSALIGSGNLQSAGTELDKLQRIHPDSPELAALRRRLETRNSRLLGESARKEEEQKEAARTQQEKDWTRSLAELFAQGKYAEARGALSLWLAADPASARAQDARLKVEEIQRGLKACESAVAEKRYQDALAALAGVERLNPADSNLAEWRRRIEAGRAAARATLTVYRLGDKATLLLDGKPIGTGGEVENESIPVGSHALAVENSLGFGVTTSQEFLEGQKAVYVYDMENQKLRAMTEADREWLARRKAAAETRHLAVEHYHGWLRGSCKGELLVNSMEVEYKPTSGTHEFRMPFRSLRLRTDGKSLDLSYGSDGKDFQSYRVQNAQAAENFKKTWDNLRNSDTAR